MMFSRLLKWIGVASILTLLAAQFMHPARVKRRVNPALTVEANGTVPSEVGKILDRACNDCHSEKTNWRWYSRVVPFSWLLMADVGMGRDEVNFSRWHDYSAKQQVNMLKNICSMARKGEMPLWYYKPLHPGSWLSSSDVDQLCGWTQQETQRLTK